MMRDLVLSIKAEAVRNALNLNAAKVAPLIASLNKALNSQSDARRVLQPLSTEELAFLLYNLGKISRFSGVLLDVYALSQIVKELGYSRSITSKMIANAFYGLGLIAKNKRLEGVFRVDALAPMLARLLSSNPNSQEIANTIYALGELTNRNHLLNPVSLPLDEMLATLSLQNCNYIDLRQLLQGLSRLQYQDGARLNELFNAVFNASYLHPNEVIKLLALYARFTSTHTRLNSGIFERLLDDLNLTYAQCNAARQRELDGILSQLPTAQKIELTTKLGLQAPVVSSITPILRVRNTQAITFQHSPEWNMAYQNQLFRLIADKNIAALERLLGIENFSPKIHQISRGRGNTSFFAGPRAPGAAQQVAEVIFNGKQTANVMVARFLQNTPAAAFKKLIAESTHDYFERLLHACSKHMQYQFAIGHDLNPVIFYLPLKELEHMVDALIKLGFYQDHRATLALVEALFLRKQLHQTDAETLTQLQYLLLDKAILFHSQHHHIVTPKLSQQRIALESQSEQLLLDEEEEREEQAASNSVAEQSGSVPAPAIQVPSHPISVSHSSLFTAPARAAVFQEESLVLPNGQPNRHAYYTSEHVHQLIQKKLNGRASFHLLAPLDYHQAPSETNLQNHLLNFLGHNHVDDNIHLIVPICINQHWVAVKLLAQQGNVSIAYYDSLENSSCRNIVMEATKKAVRDIYQPSQLIHEDKTYYFQDDASSCGAYLVENIAKHVLNPIPKRHATLDLREKHIEMLGLQIQQARTNKRGAEEEEQQDNRQKKRFCY